MTPECIGVGEVPEYLIVVIECGCDGGVTTFNQSYPVNGIPVNVNDSAFFLQYTKCNLSVFFRNKGVNGDPNTIPLGQF